MAQSTGPILAAGGIVFANKVIVQGDPPWTQATAQVGVATLVAAAGLSLLGKAMPATASAIAWLTLATVLLVRVEPKTPSPLESFASWLESGREGRIGTTAQQTIPRAGRSA